MRLQSLGVVGLSIFLVACGVSPNNLKPEVLSARIASETSTNLCTSYANPNTTPRGKLMIEAELATRGVQQCSGANYGRSSVASIGSGYYTRSDGTPQPASGNIYNCSDFASGAAAQKFFLARGGPINDPNNLDADGDGLACEWGTEIKRIASYRAPRPARTRSSFRGYSSSRCYVGPRGGTYTITSGGNKNYSGC